MRKICVFTGTRAEYGLLQPLLQAIIAHPHLQLQLLVSGTHLSQAHGFTRHQIEADGFSIDAEVDLELGDDNAAGICRAAGRGLSGCGEAFARLQPDLLVLLGDRYEAFAAAGAATLCNIPIAHLHGGEITRGAIDDALRHAISKLSLLHFTACEEYRQRVIQLGEEPQRVFHVGAIGLDGIEKRELLSCKDLQAELGLDLGQPILLLTFHPATTEPGQATGQVKELIRALDRLQLQVVITGANADAEGSRIDHLFADYVRRNPQRAIRVASLGQQRYLSTLKYAAAVVGNSSSGLIEAPSFGTPTVNIGSRQDGRLRAPSVIDCPPQADAICTAVRKALSSAFSEEIKEMTNPYRKENTVDSIIRVLESFSLAGTAKRFYDLPGTDKGKS